MLALLASVPLSDAELSGHAAGLVLNHIRHKVWAQLHVGASVAAHIVVVGGGEQGEDLRGEGDHRSVQFTAFQNNSVKINYSTIHSLTQLYFTILYSIFYSILHFYSIPRCTQFYSTHLYTLHNTLLYSTLLYFALL